MGGVEMRVKARLGGSAYLTGYRIVARMRSTARRAGARSNAEETGVVRANPVLALRIETPPTNAPMPDQPSLRISDLLPDDRPRERLERAGPESLTTPELLAILFRTGTNGRNAVQVAEDLFRELGGLPGLATATLEQLRGVNGVGPVKAIEIKAAVELGKRLSVASEDARPVVRTPDDVARLMMADLRYEPREHLYALILDLRYRVRHKRLISTGTLTESLVHPREVFAEAVRFGAVSIVLVHNHPSGDPSPSPQDIAATKRLAEASKVMGIDLMDHVIIGDGKWASMKHLGLF
jgi:DNA repair protein RadC